MKLLLFISFTAIILGCKEEINQKTKEKQTNLSNTPSIKLRWLAHWYGEAKKELLLCEMAQEFSLLHHNIEIEIEFPHEMAKLKPDDPTYNQVIDTTVKMVQQNNWPYDVMLCDAYRYQAVGNALNNPQ